MSESKFVRAVREAVLPEYKEMAKTTSNHVFSEKFENNIAEMLKSKNRSLGYRVKNIAKLAGVAVASIAVVFTVLLSSGNIGAAGGDYENFCVVYPSHDLFSSDPTKKFYCVLPLNEKTKLTRIKDVYTIGADIGFITDQSDYEYYQDLDLCIGDIFTRFRGGGHEILLSQRLKRGEKHFDVTNIEEYYYDVFINGRQAVAVVDCDGWPKIVWEDDDYLFKIYIREPFDIYKLAEIAESLRKIE